MNTNEAKNENTNDAPVLTKKQLRQQRLAQRRIQRAEKQLLTNKQNIRDHLAREIKFTSKTYQEAADDWNAMMCKIKAPEFKQDLEVFIISQIYCENSSLLVNCRPHGLNLIKC